MIGTNVAGNLNGWLVERTGFWVEFFLTLLFAVLFYGLMALLFEWMFGKRELKVEV